MQPNTRNPGSVRDDLVFLLLLILLPAVLCAENVESAGSSSQAGANVYSNLYVKVQLDSKVKSSVLKPGDVMEGSLSRSVYSRDRQLFSAGSRVHLIVDKLERRRRAPNDHWPWVIKVFIPRHEKYPTFQRAQVLLADGREIPLRVSLVSIGPEVEVQAKPRKGKSGAHPNSAKMDANLASVPSTSLKKTGKDLKALSAAPMANFEAVVLTGEELSAASHGPAPVSSRGTVTVAAGSQAKVILLGSLSASKNRAGDSFQARLVEPVYAGPTLVLPEGSVFEGKVMKSTGPRMLSRSGSVLLSFTAVTSPGGTSGPIEASVTGVEMNRQSHTRVDSEGQLKGDRPGKAWMVINLGATGGIAKEADDAAQLLIEAIVSSATDVSTAGTARIAGACASGLFMLTRHGRDVVLPKFTEMDIMFDRPVSLSTAQAGPAATQTGSGQPRSSTTEQ
jgi:hypothetical protein